MHAIQFPSVIFSPEFSRLDLFVVGKDGRGYASGWRNGPKDQIGEKWEPMTDSLYPHKYLYGLNGAPISAVSRSKGLLDIFVIGSSTNNTTAQVWSRSGRMVTQGVPVPQWSEMGNSVAGWYLCDHSGNDPSPLVPHSPITALARKPDLIDLFAIGKDGQVYTSGRSYKKDIPNVSPYAMEVSWFDFKPIGGSFVKGTSVAALALGGDKLIIFAVGKDDGKVYSSEWPSENPGEWWSSWKVIGGSSGLFPPDAPITAIKTESGYYELFCTGENGEVLNLSRKYKKGGIPPPNVWGSHGGSFLPGSQVAAIVRKAKHLDLFVTGTDGKVYTKWKNPENFPEWGSKPKPSEFFYIF